MIRDNQIADAMMFYELLEEAETAYELKCTVDNLIRAFREGIWNVCYDNEWDPEEIDIRFKEEPNARGGFIHH